MGASHKALGRRIGQTVNASGWTQPPLVAALLFGSRARGDHHVGSDWDMALVWERLPETLEPLFGTHDDREVDWFHYEKSDFEVDVLHAGCLRRSILDTGQVVWGDGGCFKRSFKEIDMDIIAWEKNLALLNEKAFVASSVLAHWLKRFNRRGPKARSNRLCGAGSDLAEAVGKLVWRIRHINPKYIEIAKQRVEDLVR